MVERARQRALVFVLVGVAIGACSGKSERSESNGATGGARSGAAGTGEGGGGATSGTNQGGEAAVGTGGTASGTGASGGTGTGGFQAGTGGSIGGTGGTPMAGSGGMPATTLPSCIQDLLDECPVEAPCVVEQTDTQRRICVDSQVREELDIQQCSGQGASFRSERRVYRPDGSLCYRVVTDFGPACEGSTETWTDGNGDPVATKSNPWASAPSVTCENGEVGNCGSPCSWPFLPSSPECELGTCPSE